MDCKRLEMLAARYMAAETTVAEEAELRRAVAGLTAVERAEASDGLLAAGAMLHAARRQRQEGVAVGIRRPSPWRTAVAATVSAAIIVGAVLLVSRPTVYGYVNGVPVTSLAEARHYSEQMFADLAHDMEPAIDVLDRLFPSAD